MNGSLLMKDALHFGIHLRALLVVEFRARFDQELLETLMPEMRVVPVSARRIPKRENDIGDRPLAPAGKDEGLLEPNVGPVAIICFPDDIDFDTCLFGRLLVKDGRSRPPVMTTSAAERETWSVSTPAFFK